METHIPRPKTPEFQVNPAIFASREQHGTLTDLEMAYKVVISNEWSVFLEADPFLATARLTAAGRTWLLPVIREDYRAELPAGMLDWVRLYQQAHKRALNHFQLWSEVSARNSTAANCPSWSGRA